MMTVPARPAEKRTGRFDPTSWGGALIVMTAFAGILYVVALINAASNYQLDRFGIRPREIAGLWGVLCAPFLHASWWHLVSNTVPFVLLGWAVLLSGVRTWLVVTAIVILVGGFATWLVAPSGIIVGASGLVFGWLGYLIARAVFARRLLWILAAVFAVFLFGGMFGGLLPSVSHGTSWQGHVCGFAAGVLAGWLLHQRDRKPRGAAAVS
jgi:membrane associated rhomboid family serine protease